MRRSLLFPCQPAPLGLLGARPDQTCEGGHSAYGARDKNPLQEAAVRDRMSPKETPWAPFEMNPSVSDEAASGMEASTISLLIGRDATSPVCSPLA